METFPTPHLLPNLFQEMPAPGTPITESEALRILRDLVRTIHALTGTLHEHLRSDVQDETYSTISDLILQYLEPAQALLDAWYEHQASPAARRRQRKAAATAPPAPEPGAVADEPETSPPPSRRRNPDA